MLYFLSEQDLEHAQGSLHDLGPYLACQSNFIYIPRSCVSISAQLGWLGFASLSVGREKKY